jgi:hypothetical protein
LLDEAADLPSLQLRPGKQVIRAMWSQAFSGQAVALDVLFDARRASGQRTLEARGPITSRHRRIATAQ